MGASIGTSNLFTITNRENKLFNKIVAIAPGNSLSECMWKGILTQHIKNEYEGKNITLKQLNKDWEEFAPESNLKNLKDKKIYIYLSQADVVVPYSCAQKLLEAMEEEGITPIIKENKYLGHYGTIINSYFFPEYLDY